MAPFKHHLKRPYDSHASYSDDESFEGSKISTKNLAKYIRSSKPDPHRARRGGGGRLGDRHWYSSVSLPKRTINYDLAESFMDHSSNPLSSDLYKIRFKHSAKQWPNGRFINYREKLDKLDGNIIDITSTRTYPIVPKRKRIENPPTNTLPSLVLMDPIVQEQKKKLADKQTNFYANLFGCAKIPRFTTANQIKKTDCISNPTSVNRENKLD